jgi:hypothetical protein
MILDCHEPPWILTPATSVYQSGVEKTDRTEAPNRGQGVPRKPKRGRYNQLAKLIVDIATPRGGERQAPVAPRSNRDTIDEYTALTV